MDNLARVETVERPERQSLKLLGRVLAPDMTDDVAAAIHLIKEEQHKTKWDSKEKWLRFEGSTMPFLTAIRKRLIAANRQQYGTSRTLRLIARLEDGVPVLYVPTE